MHSVLFVYVVAIFIHEFFIVDNSFVIEAFTLSNCWYTAWLSLFFL